MYTVHLEGGPRRVNHAAVSIGGSVYSFGGYCTGENYNESRPIDVHALNTHNYRWRLVMLNDDSVCPFQRYGHTVVSHDGRVYLWGGRNDRTACHTLYCFDPTTASWSAPKVTGDVPLARDGHSACVVNDKMYIFGGFEEAYERFTQDLYCLDLRTMIWKLIRHIGAPPSYRDFHTAVAMGHKMYVFGGRGDASGPYHSQEEIYCNKVLYLDTLTNEWVQPETSGCIPKGRRSHSAFVYKGRMMIFGGYNGNEDCHFNDLYTFDPVACVWAQFHPRGTPPCARRRQSCCLNGDRVFLFGGTSPTHPEGRDNMPLNINAGDDEDEIYLAHNLSRLQDHNDLHVLDFSPKLTTLCFLSIIKFDLDYSHIPRNLIHDLTMMKSDNNITHSSRPEPRG